MQPGICAMFALFSFLCSLSSHCTFTSVFEIFKSPMATDFPRVIIITSILFRRSKQHIYYAYKRYVTKVFCIYRKLFRNRSQRTVSLTPWLQTWTLKKWHLCDHGCKGRKLQRKNFILQEERLIRHCSNCWTRNLPIPYAGASNKLILDEEIKRS